MRRDGYGRGSGPTIHAHTHTHPLTHRCLLPHLAQVPTLDAAEYVLVVPPPHRGSPGLCPIQPAPSAARAAAVAAAGYRAPQGTVAAPAPPVLRHLQPPVVWFDFQHLRYCYVPGESAPGGCRAAGCSCWATVESRAGVCGASSPSPAPPLPVHTPTLARTCPLPPSNPPSPVPRPVPPDNVVFQKLPFPVRDPLAVLGASVGWGGREVEAAHRVWGLNDVATPLPLFWDLFREHALAPFFVFQV